MTDDHEESTEDIRYLNEWEMEESFEARQPVAI